MYIGADDSVIGAVGASFIGAYPVEATVVYPSQWSGRRYYIGRGGRRYVR